MEYKMTVLNSESIFRNYVNSNIQNISQIIIFKDILECKNYFYCFNKNGSIVVTTSSGYQKFSVIRKIYKRLAKRIGFSLSNYPDQTLTIILVPEKERL